MPLFKTNKMPVRAARSSMRGLPPLGLGVSSGNSGSTTSHSSSVTSSLAMPSSYPPPGFVRRTKSEGVGRLRRNILSALLQMVREPREAGLPIGKLSSGSFSSDGPLALRFSALLTDGGERLEFSQTKRDKEIPGGRYKRT
jgi:hypothetical protein